MTAGKLAICGGTPVCKDGLSSPPWPPVTEKTAQRLMEVYRSRQWSFNSPAEQEFQRAYADYHDAKHGIFMSNGTTTLESALAVCGIGEGDEVIVPALTWMATAMAVHYVGATPIFVDIEPTTLCMDPAKAAAAVTDKTRAIIPVHIYGSMADLEKLQMICDKHDLVMIEDCAHMQGGKWNGRGVGSWGKVGSFSFQQSKTVASGEGGICITNDDEIAERIFCYKHIGYHSGNTQGSATQGPPEGLVCRNYRGTAFEATILLEQVELLEQRMKTYAANARRLGSVIDSLEGVRVQSPGRLATVQGYYAFVLILDSGPLASVSCKRIWEAAAAEGLSMGATYGPVYKHQLYNMPGDTYRIDQPCTVADTVATNNAVLFQHQWLASDLKTIDAIGEVIVKIVANADDLVKLAKEQQIT